jgi:hypothetical protein
MIDAVPSVGQPLAIMGLAAPCGRGPCPISYALSPATLETALNAWSLAFRAAARTHDRSRSPSERTEARHPPEVRLPSADRESSKTSIYALRATSNVRSLPNSSNGDWIARKQNLLNTGPTGTGKTRAVILGT